MIYDTFSLWNGYREIFAGKPSWFIIIFIEIYVTSLYLCLRFEKKGLPGKKFKGFAASLNYILWWLVILVLPVFGTLYYIIGAIIPFIIWRKIHPGDDRFSLNCSLRIGQLWLMVAFGVFGKLLEYILYRVGFISLGAHFDFIAAFVLFIIIVSCDMITSFLNKRVYILLKSSYNRPLVNKGELLGLKYQISDDLEYGEDYSKRLKAELKAARIVANEYFAQHPIATKNALNFIHDGKVEVGEYNFFYSVSQYNKKNMPDVTETKWMMFHGLTRILMLEAYDDKYVQRTLYVVIPRIRYMLMRFGILLAVLLALFTPVFNGLHLKIVNFFANLV